MVPIHLFSVSELLLTGCSPAEPVSSSFRHCKGKEKLFNFANKTTEIL